MNLNRLVISLFLCLSAVQIHADQTSEIRESLPSKKGYDRIDAYNSLYYLSLDSDDVSYQLKCLDDLIAECHRQGNLKEEADARVTKLTHFYNCDLSDSIYEQTKPTLELLASLGDWKSYYETWTILVDSYNFSGKTNTGLKEVQEMHSDAMKRDDKFGQGMAYYSMGNVYANMHNIEEADSSYQKSLSTLLALTPRPFQLTDVFAAYGDILELQHEYHRLNDLTIQWKKFLDDWYSKEEGKSADVNSWAYYYLACAQAALGLANLEKASDMLDELRKRSSSEDSFKYMKWLFYRAELCMKQGFYDEALALNDKRMRLLESADDSSELIRVRKQRAEILSALGRYQEAAEMYNQMYIINDSINSHDTKRQLTEMNTLFGLGELEKKHAQAMTRNAIIIASIIVLSLVIFIFFRLRSAKRLKVAHLKLEDAHGKLEETHQQLLTAYDQLEETTIAKERIESDLRIARDIQMSMVPSNFPERPDVDLYASMTPAKEVGGDLYGYHLIDDHLYFCLGDVSGKGVPASLFMAQATRLFRTLAAQKMMPAEIATRINDALSGEDNERGMFVTMFLGLVDLKTGHLDFCNAGHNPPVLVGDGTAEFIEMIPNAPIGLWPELPYEGEEIADITGKAFFVYSDGLNEAENRQQEQFSDERLVEILKTRPFESSRQTIEMLKAEVEAHRDGAEPNDDLTMLCLKVTPSRCVTSR